jgi:hypothetical protein
MDSGAITEAVCILHSIKNTWIQHWLFYEASPRIMSAMNIDTEQYGFLESCCTLYIRQLSVLTSANECG